MSFTLKEPIIDAWNATIQKYRKNKVKRVCYLSLEFLMGRLLTNNLLNLGMYDKVKKSLEQSGVDLDNVIQAE